jgi:hypothetical protein
LANSLELDRYRFHFRVLEQVRIPPGMAGNVFRGAFGFILRGLDEHAYFRLFEPSLAVPGPSGFANPPRPFVLRCRHLNGFVFAPGSEFFVDVNVFETRLEAWPWFERVFSRMPRTELTGVDDLGHLKIPLDPLPDSITQITIRFETPTELKAGGRVQKEPNFASLFARMRDRISSLTAFYGLGPLDVDFGSLGERAKAVRTERICLEYMETNRRSSRTGQTHSIGGFTGEMDFVGELGDFLPWIACARWAGVGRHTVWGNGELHVTRTA